MREARELNFAKGLPSEFGDCWFTSSNISNRIGGRADKAGDFVLGSFSWKICSKHTITFGEMQASFSGRSALLPTKSAEPQRNGRARTVKVQAVAAPPALDTRQSERASISVSIEAENKSNYP